MSPEYVTVAVPAFTRNVAPVAPDSVPPPKFEVPVTDVRLTPLVPPDDLIAEKLALRAMPLAIIAGAACTVLLIVPVALVTLIVPPTVAFNPVPVVVWIVSELKFMFAPEVPVQLTPLPPALVLVELVAPWKSITFVAPGALTLITSPALSRFAAPVTVTLPPPAPCMKPVEVLPVIVSVPNVRVPAELF